MFISISISPRIHVLMWLFIFVTFIPFLFTTLLHMYVPHFQDFDLDTHACPIHVWSHLVGENQSLVRCMSHTLPHLLDEVNMFCLAGHTHDNFSFGKLNTYILYYLKIYL